MRLPCTVGLYDSRGRVYSPTLMRWLQTDPIGLDAGNNDYLFLANTPVDQTDPSGLIPTKEQQRAWDELYEKYMMETDGLSVPRNLGVIDRVKRRRHEEESQALATALHGYWKGAYLEWARQERLIRSTYRWLENWYRSRWEMLRKKGLTCETWDEYRERLPSLDKMLESGWKN